MLLSSSSVVLPPPSPSTPTLFRSYRFFTLVLAGWNSLTLAHSQADVYDHMEYVLISLNMFAGIGENLIDYTSNMKSYEMNQVMRQRTLATMPLTLLTEYFVSFTLLALLFLWY
ncbi:hypothetical protein C8J56DRAFT_1063785 [Mycena floridula]|nr:hypothetical protein C8J56DRAFT_1063785 [Mycena floridula]